MVPEALQAAEEAEKDGISVEVVDPRTLLPLDEETIIASVKKTTRALTAHEAVTRGGFGAELAAVDPAGRLRLPRRADRARRARSSRRSRSRRRWSSGSSRTRPTCSRPSSGRWRGPSDGDRGQAPAAGPGDGVRHDRQVAEGRGRAGQEARAALRARHRQGDAGGRGRGRRRAAEDRRRLGRGRGRPDDRLHRQRGRGRPLRERRCAGGGRSRVGRGGGRGAGRGRSGGRAAPGMDDQRARGQEAAAATAEAATPPSPTRPCARRPRQGVAARAQARAREGDRHRDAAAAAAPRAGSSPRTSSAAPSPRRRPRPRPPPPPPARSRRSS